MRVKYWSDFVIGIIVIIACIVGWFTGYFNNGNSYSEIEKMLILILAFSVLFGLRMDMKGANRFEAVSAAFLGIAFLLAVVLLVFL
ncbi:hypothetical protein SIN07_08055 [Pediococcus inopinatus]|mgnify:CR=1 FL=1|uniref:DUF3953 domain-containing protein n=1 Tax=Pediococcus inopinatus TaxID=114090 RepID=A0ABZ0Q7K2_9LACO|nr:hypothetical protein [Pediococcus inopinatus]AVK99364.1 hypothetical protein PI20285_01115 [Pediococcus inopinatus]KRN60984.1 hypothetical protein IV83_GL001198 [Pediococcus inopinatus]WPC18203.1 hypothetical protein N6G94_04190 [Pediococcus inopinatus]WPC20409.1 hypothetical protein N6G95_04270 [Pediococcus inopinatus]WPC22112.1 hypothetical protein N6G96_02520 [Pediococcus inopinatus]